MKCKPGWLFRLEIKPPDIYPKLIITVPGWDSAGASSTDAVFRAAQHVAAVYGDPERVSTELVQACARLHKAWGQHRRFTVDHPFPVPEATYTEQSWRRWIFDRCCDLETAHELGEWFRDGAERPFLPLHGPGENPYVVHEFRPVDDALTTQDGSKREPYT